MDSLTVAGIMVLLLFVVVISGVFVGIGLSFLSVVGLWWISGDLDVAAKLVGSTTYNALMDYVFGVVPFFVSMGLLANISGASTDLYAAFNLVTRRIRGGLGVATVFANAVFAAITGVSVASAAVFSKVSLPEMLKHGYNKKFALGVVAGSSVLGMLIPPSILFVIYGVISEEAIGRLLIAGILPGLVLTAIYSVGITIMVRRKPELVMAEGANGSLRLPPLPVREYLRAFSSCWGIVVLILITLGGIWGGFFTPTEAGAVGAFGALVLGLAKRKVTFSSFWEVLLETGIVTAGIFFLLISAQMYSRMLALSGLVEWTSKFVISLNFPPLAVILMFTIVWLVLGCLIDSASIMLLTLPLMIPIVKDLGFSLIWFGVVSVIVIEMGLLTPPFGMVVFAMKSALGGEAKIEDIFQGSYPFLLMMILAAIIVIAFPTLSTWLPSLM
jgi:tripartite ATP-independent transporter DctM subunit